MDIISYVIGKNSGGGGGGSYNVLLDTTLTYNSAYKMSSIIKEIKPFTVDSSLTTFENFFNGCSNLLTIPLIDTKSITDMNYCFYNCTKLKNVPVLDTSSLLVANNSFNGCNALTDESLDNILQMCINAKKFTGTPTLYYLGFRKQKYSQAKLESLPHWADFVAAGWETGYF